VKIVIVLVSLLTLIAPTVVSSETVIEEILEYHGIELIRLWNPEFTEWCSELAKVEDDGLDHHFVGFHPKRLLPSRARYAGEVWVFNDSDVEFPVSELHESLQNLGSKTAAIIQSVNCFLVDTPLDSTEHVLVRPSKGSADEVLKALRRK